MACPRDPVGFAVRRCPFLRELSASHDEDYVRAIASNPMRPAGDARTPVLQDEELTDFSLTFRLFHGPSGVVPLAGFGAKEAALVAPVRSCPHLAVASPAEPISAPVASTAARPRTAPLPLASMSLSFGNGPNFGDFLRSLRNNSNKPQPARRRPNNTNASGHSQPRPPGGSSSNGTGLPSSSSSGGGANSSGRVVRGPKPPAGSAAAATGHTASAGNAAGSGPAGNTAGPAGSTAGRLQGSSGSSASGNASSGAGKAAGSAGSAHAGPGNVAGGAASGAAGASASSSGAASASSACPLRTWLGPMAGLVFNKYDKLVCPPAIVSARAALARTPPIKSLRPQALPVKLLAVGAMSAGANIPAGAWREHFEKFSAGWFVAVHATIPFVAMLRKAVVLPKGAIAVTIVAAIAGQVIGSRLERMRLAAAAEQRAAVAAAPRAAVAAPVAEVAAVGAETGGRGVQQQRRVVVVQGGNGSSGASSSKQGKGNSKGRTSKDVGCGAEAAAVAAAALMQRQGACGEVHGGWQGVNPLAQLAIKC